MLGENCVEPFFIETEQAGCYLNISRLVKIKESEGSILAREDYDKRLSSELLLPAWKVSIIWKGIWTVPETS